MSDHAEIIRAADAHSHRESDYSWEAFGRILRERDEARADAEALRGMLRDTCDVIVWMSGSEDFGPGRRAHRYWVDVQRPKFAAALAALAAAQEPPHCTCQSSWPSDLRCPACEAAAQEPPAADEFAGLADVTRVLPVVAEFVEKHGRLPIDLAEATNGPQPPADGGDRDA